MIIPLGNHCWVCWWKNFENRSTFSKVMGKSRVSYNFFDSRGSYSSFSERDLRLPHTTQLHTLERHSVERIPPPRPVISIKIVTVKQTPGKPYQMSRVIARALRSVINNVGLSLSVLWNLRIMQLATSTSDIAPVSSVSFSACCLSQQISFVAFSQ